MATVFPVKLNFDEELRDYVYTVSEREAKEYEALLKKHGMNDEWDEFELILPSDTSERLQLMQQIAAPGSGLVTRLPLGNRDMVGDDEGMIYRLSQNLAATTMATAFWGQYYPLFGTTILCDVTPEGEWY